MSVIKVTLIKGENSTAVWKCKCSRFAKRKAHALATLHSAECKQDTDGNWVVNATQYYQK